MFVSIEFLQYIVDYVQIHLADMKLHLEDTEQVNCWTF